MLLLISGGIMGMLKTVRVKTDAKDNPDGFYDINETDFDSSIHTLYEAAPAVKEAPAEVKKEDVPAPAEVKKDKK